MKRRLLQLLLTLSVALAGCGGMPGGSMLGGGMGIGGGPLGGSMMGGLPGMSGSS